MDKRYVRIIANNMRVKIPNVSAWCILASIALTGYGVMMVTRDSTIIGYIATGLAMPFYLYGFIKFFVEKGKAVKKFIADYEKEGKLPPWPED